MLTPTCYGFYFCVRPRFFAKAHCPSPFEYALVALFAVDDLVFSRWAFAAESALVQHLFRLEALQLADEPAI